MVSQAGHQPGVRRDRAEQWTGIRMPPMWHSIVSN